VGSPAPYAPVADWVVRQTGDHCGDYVDLVTGQTCTITRTTPKTIYDPATGRIHDVPAGKLAVNPWSAYKSGGIGYAAIPEEARTNYLLHSWFDVDSNGDGRADSWSVMHNAGTGTYAQALVEGVYRNGQSIRLLTGSGYQIGLSQSSAVGTFAAGETATFSAYIGGTIAGASALLQLRAFSSTAVQLGVVNGNTLAVTATPTLFSQAYASLPAGTSYVLVAVVLTNFNTGDVTDVVVSAAQLEKGAFSTSYIPTTTAAVARAADNVTIPTTGWTPSTGTMMGVVGAGVMPTANYVLMWRKDSSNFVGLQTTYAYAGGGTRIVYYGAGNVAASGYKILANPSPWVLAGKWTAGSPAYGYLNGSVSTGSVNTYLSDVVGVSARVGSYDGGVYHFHGPIERLVVYDKALSDAQLATTALTTDLLNGIEYRPSVQFQMTTTRSKVAAAVPSVTKHTRRLVSRTGTGTPSVTKQTRRTVGVVTAAQLSVARKTFRTVRIASAAVVGVAQRSMTRLLGIVSSTVVSKNAQTSRALGVVGTGTASKGATVVHRTLQAVAHGLASMRFILPNTYRWLVGLAVVSGLKRTDVDESRKEVDVEC